MTLRSPPSSDTRRSPAIRATNPESSGLIFERPARAVLALIGAFLVLRLILAATLGLGVDETYTLANARDLSLSYFDHPPLHYWLIHLLMPVLGEGRAARLPFILLFAGSSWLLFALTRHLFGGQAGFWAVLALNLSAFFTLSGGGLVPDGPLQFFLLAAALVLARGLFPVGDPPSPWTTWLFAGLWLGLAGLSKYHGALFALGLMIYLVSVPSRRPLLRHPAPWVGALIALIVVSPALIWNMQHQWVSLAFQTGRGLPQGLRVGQVFANIAGQMAWILPWIFVPLVIAGWGAVRAGRGAERSWYCLCLALPAITLFTIVPLWGSRGLPHWQMPGWLLLYPVLGAYLARAAVTGWPRRWAITSAAALVGLIFIIVGHAATGLGRVWFPGLLAKDPTLEALEWTPLRHELQARGLLDRPELFVVVPHWITAGKIDHALGDALPVVVFGQDQRHFAFRYDPAIFVGRDALIMGRSDDIEEDLPALRTYFESIEELPLFAFGRSGLRELETRILLAHTLKSPLPAAYGRAITPSATAK
ncbi:MAG: glycosyltransferase family 39 protein [Chromatiaceae bacterium]|nr:glycosyltransferase family 39 protein [Chromatiaceae bacterium]